MIGTKISKPLITKEDVDKYSTAAEWCNKNGATIAERDDYYEVIEAPTPEPIVWDDDVTNLQMIIADQYEEIIALRENNNNLQDELINTEMAVTELYEAVIGN